MNLPNKREKGERRERERERKNERKKGMNNDKMLFLVQGLGEDYLVLGTQGTNNFPLLLSTFHEAKLSYAKPSSLQLTSSVTSLASSSPTTPTPPRLAGEENIVA